MSNIKRILTGHRPTGPRHIGHLYGTLINWIAMQHSYDCFFLVADLHVLTTDFSDPKGINKNTLEMVTDWLAAGIDPERASLILQSAIPEHVQLSMLFSMLVTVARLERVPTYKDQSIELNLNPSLGLLSYPVLQAADILLYKAETVPVGEDQLPHLELTREIARRFNNLYGHSFPEPEALLSDNPRIPGIDNRTMHTSRGNAIFLKDSPEETTRKVMQMYTDPTRLRATDPGHVDGNPVFNYLDIFEPDANALSEMKALYQAGRIGDVAVKMHLAQVMNESLAPLRERRQQYAKHPERIIDILVDGTERARPVAQGTLNEVMKKMGLNPHKAMQSLVESTTAQGVLC
jgi:tryptophanyl-tRNA synthetase